VDSSETETHTCKSCSNSFVGAYCNLCGEKVLLPSDRTFRSLLKNVLIAITFADNKFIKTLWLVVKNPGFLSTEYVNGVRVKYLRPLQLFFILNLVYFLFPVFQLFNSSLFTQMYLLPHRAIVRELVLNKLDTSTMSLQAYTLLYDAKSQRLAKLLIVVFILIASVPMSIIYRKKKIYFTDHAAFAVELACFNLAINALLLSAIFWVLNTAFNWAESGWIQYLDDLAITVIFILTNTYFLWRASRMFYHQRKATLSIKIFLGLIGLYLSLEVYRILLFFVTFWSV
jgi:hypothetical protein